MNMNDTTEPALSGQIPLLEPYKDRSSGLIIFGVLTIMLGCLSGLLSILMLVQAAFVANVAGAPGVSRLLPAILTYIVLGVALIWLGIGSAMVRRWARALLLIFSWSWLVVGVLMTVVMLFLLPQIFQNASLPGPAAGIASFFIFAVFGVGFVLLPGIWTYFFNSPHVKATCDARDPVPRWTDACPLPVLAVSLWSVSFGGTTLCMTLTGNAVVPFFGTFLTGAAGSLLCVLLAAVWFYSAWSLYRLETPGWWLVLASLCLMMVSSIVTFARHDITEMYVAMGYSQLELAQIRKVGAAMQNSMIWFVCFWAVPWIGYLLFIKKYLGPRRVGQSV